VIFDEIYKHKNGLFVSEEVNIHFRVHKKVFHRFRWKSGIQMWKSRKTRIISRPFKTKKPVFCKKAVENPVETVEIRVFKSR